MTDNTYIDNTYKFVHNLITNAGNIRGMEFTASLILGPVVGALLTILYQKLRNIIGFLPSRRIIRGLIDKDHKVSIAIASIGLKEFKLIKEKGTSKLPGNVNLISVYDALGAAYLQDNISELFKKTKVKIYSSYAFQSYDQNIITIGGSSVNNITYSLMEDRKIDQRFRIIYPDHYATDIFEGEEIRFNAKIRNVDESIVEDYGFIIMAKSPFNPKKKVCVLAGLWPYGTYGAIYSIVNPKDTGLYKGWKGLRNKKNGFFAAIRISVAEENPGVPSLVYIREIDSPVFSYSQKASGQSEDDSQGYIYNPIIFP